MLLNLDLCVIFLIDILVILILTGYVSLCERRILAIVQLRIGPALCLFGILTPITDGVKLFLKFVLFVVSFDMFYLIGAMFITAFCIFMPWFFFPIGFIILIDCGFTVILLLVIHVFSNLFSTFMVGLLLFSSCFVYLSAMRSLFFSIISESLLILLFLALYLLDYFSFFGIKDMCIGQLYINNFYMGGVLFISIFWVGLLLDGLRLPFDYMECESELVSGLITELSGIFFCIYSVMEISHVLLSTLMFVAMCFGGLFVCFKAIVFLVFGFFWPRVVGFRMKITSAQTFIILFLIIIAFIMFNWLAITKIIAVLF